MEEEFIPYEQASELKELGFNEKCLKCYDISILLKNGEYYLDDWYNVGLNGIKSPLYQQAFRWFREKYQMVFCYEPNLKKDLTYIFFIYIEITGEKVFVVESKYDEEAELACLNKLIEIIKSHGE